MNTCPTCLTCLNRRVLVAGALLLLPLGLTGCGGDQADAAAPPEITYGRDVCDRCGMIISDDRFAGALVAADGTAELFDDIGEMLQSAREMISQERRVWVHDWSSRDWIEGEAAAFVWATPELTPMGTGLHAFRDAEAAAAFAAEQGSTAPAASWADLLTGEPPVAPAHDGTPAHQM